MWFTLLFATLAGVMGTNALPHFVKGLLGEEFPNVLGNSPLRNALAGWLGLVLAAGFAAVSDLPAHPWPGAVALSVGALAMTVFHGRRGAYRLNDALRLPNPA
ncbi:hypothetical protein GPX89_13635 [Nocardia sp. ET3-3]|uniref:Uncharacterized protein n=2 Tax=Nocardia terrae TaxID=2675851 RepID=A0A7K1UVH4_9NOCA|nr:hypothetical protein [Nocardia terrae]